MRKAMEPILNWFVHWLNTRPERILRTGRISISVYFTLKSIEQVKELRIGA